MTREQISDLKAQVAAVQQARVDLEQYVANFGRTSGGAADRRRRLRSAEEKLLQLVMESVRERPT